MLIGFELFFSFFYNNFMIIKFEGCEVICYVLVWDFGINKDVR